MRNFKVRALLGLLLLSGLASSCGVTRPGGAPAANLAGLYRDQVATDTLTLAQLPWRTLFTDPALQALIAQGIANNLDLQVAGARVRQADAYFRQSQAAFLPSLSATGSVTRSRQAAFFPNQEGTQPTATFYQVYGSASWEADVWGKLRNSKRSYLALLLQSEAGRRAVQTGVVADIANGYYQLLALDQQLAITEQTVQSRIQSVETVRALSEAGILTGANLVQSEALRYAAEVIVPDLRQQIRETENALSQLLGGPPAAIQRGTLADQPPAPPLRTGVPAQLLRFRPDVQQAEYGFRSAFALTNAARAYFYPALTLTASGGYASFDASRLLDPVAVFGSLAGGLVQPLLTRGVNRARLRVSEAQQLEAQLAFQTTLLTAGQEVTNALYSYQAAGEKVVIRARQLDALEKSVTYSQALLANGFADYTEVLTAQQNLLTAQLNGVSDRRQQLQAVTDLYRALGGGWQ